MHSPPEPLAFGFFLAVKFVGYSVIAYELKRRIPGTKAPAWIIGGARVLIGMFTLGVLGYPALRLGFRPGFIYLALLPVRIGEWLLLLNFYFSRDWNWKRSFKLAACCAVFSFLLDILGGLAMWIAVISELA